MTTYLTYPQRLPGLSADVTRRPKFSTEVQTHASGGEVRFGYWNEVLWEWDIAYEILRDGLRYGLGFDELRQLVGLFLACGGPLNGFQYKDQDDNQVFRQLIGTTDGVTAAFTLSRTLGANNPSLGLSGSETIGFLDITIQPFNLYVDSSSTAVATSDPVYGYTLSTTTPKKQQLVFNTAPPSGHSLYADFAYLFYVRFQDGKQDFDKFMHQLWSLKKVTLQSLRF